MQKRSFSSEHVPTAMTKVGHTAFVGALTLLLLGATGCAATAVGYAAGTTPSERDALHRTTQRPALEVGADMITSTVESDIPVTLDQYLAFSDATPLERVLPGSTNIPRVIRTEPLSDRWGVPGARRRVVLADGNTALEEILEMRLPEAFRYMVWNFTSAAGRFVKYAVGEFKLSPNPSGGIHVVWTYSFRPQGWPSAWILGPFVHDEYHAFMVNGITNIRESSIAFAAKMAPPPASPAAPAASTAPAAPPALDRVSE
jgi:hypothetical protein